MDLSTLSKGQLGVINSIEAKPELAVQLLEQGFTPGSSVRMVSGGIFQDPIAFAVRGTTIALRRSEAECIKLQA
jgi:ferrous iron transport protein A